MQHLGYTRSSRKHDHLLQTPDTFIRAPLPGMHNATAIVHAGPTIGAGFTQYTVEFEPGGSFTTGQSQTFLYVLEGSINSLSAHDFAYLPPAANQQVVAEGYARAVVIEKPYLPLDGAPPSAFAGQTREIVPIPLMGDDALCVQTLIPGDRSFDFAVNLMTFQPGASLALVEIHIMEHGLMMLEGGGIYRLNDRWYPVTAGDFIYMAPYCPQWFCAVGKKPAKYLIYKDWNR